MEFLIDYDHLEHREMHLPSLNYPIIAKMKDIKKFEILDDDDQVYFSGYIYNSEEANYDDYEEVMNFMEDYGCTQIVIDGEIL